MSERLLEAFREEAEHLIRVPAFELLEARGRARRRQRHAVVGAVAATVLAVTGFLVTMGGEPRPPQQPADPAPSPAEVVFMGLESPPLVTYERPPGWGWEGFGTVSDERHERNVARFGAVVLERVAKDPCQFSRGAPDYQPAATEPAPLAAQLASMARVRVVLGPVPDDRFGLPALHLRLRGTGPACTAAEGIDSPFTADQDFADGGRWPDPVGTVDLWFVDVGDQVVLVQAVTGRQVSPDNSSALARVVDSVVITPPAPD